MTTYFPTHPQRSTDPNQAAWTVWQMLQWFASQYDAKMAQIDAALAAGGGGGGGAPSGPAGGDLAGTFPNPTVALLAIGDNKVATANKDGVAGTPSMRTLGAGAQQAAAGNDARLSDARAPTGAAGGDLAGSTYPNPVVAALAITDAKVAAANKDGAAATPSMRTLGVGGAQAAAGNDTRLSDSRWTRGNGNATAQVANAADTYVTGSALPVDGILKVGTTLRWIISITKTAAGTAAPALNIRFGTAGTTADTSRVAITAFPAQTAIADTGIMIVEAVVQSVGAAGVVVGCVLFTHDLATTGLAARQMVNQTLTSAGFDTTVANLIAGLSINPGASGAWTFKTVSAQIINPNV